MSTPLATGGTVPPECLNMTGPLTPMLQGASLQGVGAGPGEVGCSATESAPIRFSGEPC